ncbi:MAG: YceI family protein [Gammaproteobacteria bacterium]
MNRFLIVSALAPVLLIAAASQAADTPAAQAAIPTASAASVPAGAYTLDKAHASLLFRVNHLSFSHWTARFTRFDAQLRFDPADPAKSSVKVTVDPKSIASDNAPEGFMATLAGPEWLDAGKYPEMTYRSTKVERNGTNGLRISGQLTLHGVTKPVTLVATYNGGYAGHPYDPHARIGFSAKGTLKRSDFGVAYGIPAPGATMGVFDDVELIVESEFTGPPLAETAAPAKK